MASDQLKQTLLSLHASLVSGEPLDPELQSLLRLLDADIHARLMQENQAGGADSLASAAPTPTPTGLGNRAQEISARFAAAHPHLEPVLRELTDTLQRIGI